MAPCERSGGINGHQMDRWLGLSPEHHPLFSELTLAQNSEQRLKEALGRLGRARDMTEVFGKRALKDVLGCFEPILALRTPTDKHTGGNTLYAQVAAAYEAYRAGNLDQDAMDAVEAFTEQILFAIAGNTQPPDSSVSSLTYENELFSGAINATRYETDALGEQALRALDHIQTLFTTHRHSLPAQHNDQRQSIQARRALPKKVIGVLTAIELILAGCTGGISPTILPTEVKPAITAPLPTSVPTEIPTLTPTTLPTEATTPTAAPMPGKDVPFPSTWETHADPQEAKLAFEELYAKNEDVRADVEKMKPIIRQIGKNQGIDNLVITGYYWRPGTGNGNWALVITDTDGSSYMYQVKTEEGWLNYADAGGYSLLKETDPANIRLIAVHPPENGTLEPDNLNGYTTFVLVDANGQMKAVLNTAEDQWKTGDGSPYLETNRFTSFNPETTTEEECKANIIHDPFRNINEFLQDIQLLHMLDKKINDSDISATRPSQLSSNITNGPPGWLMDEVYTERYATNVDPSFCGIVENSYGQEVMMYMLPYSFTLKDGSRITIFIPTIINNTLIIESLRRTDGFIKGTEFYNRYYNLLARMEALKNWDTMNVYMLTGGEIPLDNLSSEQTLLAKYYNLSKKLVGDDIMDLVRGQGTEKTVDTVLKHGFIAAYNVTFSNLNNTPLK